MRQRETEAALQRLVREYDVAPFAHTRIVEIAEGVIPHSHPVLTLNTRHVDEPEQLLLTFLQEMHGAVRWDEALFQRLQARFPGRPDHPPDGARDLSSTYRHVLVCALEYEALRIVLGSERARACVEVAAEDRYRAIYRLALMQRADILALAKDAHVTGRVGGA